MRHATITIPSPCHQSWAAMSPTETGRHCASCQETVADFTLMSDAEILAYLRRYPAVSCGRFREHQLSRPLLVPAQPVAGWRRWGGATLALLGIGALAGPKAQGQAVPSSYWGGPVPATAVGQSGLATPAPASPALPLQPLPDVPASAVSNSKVVAADSLVIRGVVYNRLFFRQAGARLRVRYGGTGHTTTDERGQFQLVVARKDLTENSQLYVVAWRESDDDHYLKAQVPVVPSKMGTYVVRLKRYERIRSGKFR